MIGTGRREEESEACLAVNTQGYAIFRTVFHDELALDLVVMFLDSNMNVTAADVESRCKVSRSTAFRRLSELNKAGLLTYEWKVTSESPPKAIKVYSMPEHIRAALKPFFKGLREALSSMLEKRR